MAAGAVVAGVLLWSAIATIWTLVNHGEFTGADPAAQMQR